MSHHHHTIAVCCRTCLQDSLSSTSAELREYQIRGIYLMYLIATMAKRDALDEFREFGMVHDTKHTKQDFQAAMDWAASKLTPDVMEQLTLKAQQAVGIVPAGTLFIKKPSKLEIGFPRDMRSTREVMAIVDAAFDAAFGMNIIEQPESGEDARFLKWWNGSIVEWTKFYTNKTGKEVDAPAILVIRKKDGKKNPVVVIVPRKLPDDDDVFFAPSFGPRFNPLVTRKYYYMDVPVGRDISTGKSKTIRVPALKFDELESAEQYWVTRIQHLHKTVMNRHRPSGTSQEEELETASRWTRWASDAPKSIVEWIGKPTENP